MGVRFTTALVLAWFMGSLAHALGPSDARLVTVSKIWDSAPHNAFTDLVHFNGQFYATFREASKHAVPDLGQPGGMVRVLNSPDGTTWSSLATFSLGATNHDLRDPKLTVTPDNELMLLATDVPHAGSGGTRRSYTWFSADGSDWSSPAPALGDSRWLWRTEWNPANDVAYGISYANNSTRLHASPSGSTFGTVVPTLAEGNEAGLLFTHDGTAIALVRREGEGALVGTSTNLTTWNFSDTGTFVGGPDLIQIPDGRIVVGGRFLDNFSSNARTSLGFLDPLAGTIEEFLELPSGGDTGYPGMAWHDDKLWVSYYSSHQNSKSSIYLATVSFYNRTDTFSRLDSAPSTNSLGTTEGGGFAYLERGNTASQSIPNGTAHIGDGRLLLTGSGQGAPFNSNTGGAYLRDVDQANVTISVDVGFDLAGSAPSGVAGDDSNKFNNTFLLMLRSRDGQNFGSNNALENGLVAIEFGPNGDLQIREQTGSGSSGLSTVRSSFNYFTNAVASRQPLPGVLPATYGPGGFDLNQNGYLDMGESFTLGVELVGQSLTLYVNGVPYGAPLTLIGASAANGQVNGVGLHKNRLGSSGGFLDQVVSNIVLDNLTIGGKIQLPGDYNYDGTVDAADYVVWRDSLGKSGSGLPADGDRNQQVDANDYAVWKANFGRIAAGAAASNSLRSETVPEPQLASLALQSAIAFSLCVRSARFNGRKSSTGGEALRPARRKATVATLPVRESLPKRVDCRRCGC